MLFSDSVMRPDPRNNDKKCGIDPRSSERIFDLRDDDAQEKECQEKCAQISDCVAMSGIWGKFCFGCNVALNNEHYGMKAYKKSIKLFDALAII